MHKEICVPHKVSEINSDGKEAFRCGCDDQNIIASLHSSEENFKHFFCILTDNMWRSKDWIFDINQKSHRTHHYIKMVRMHYIHHSILHREMLNLCQVTLKGLY